MKFLVDDIFVNENDTITAIRKKVADRLGAHVRGLQITVLSRRWVRNEQGGSIRLSILAETNEFLRSTSSFAYNGDAEISFDPLEWKFRPVVAGFGLPGIVAALYLAKRGLRPIVLERGLGLYQKTTSPKDKETLNPDGEGGMFMVTGAMFIRDKFDPKLKALLESEGIVFENKDAFWMMSSSQYRSIVSSIHAKILKYGGEICFECTYLGVKRRFGKIKGVYYSQGGEEKFVKTDKVLLTYGSEEDTCFVGTSIPTLAQTFNQCIYGKKVVDPRVPQFYSESMAKIGNSRALLVTGMASAKIIDVGSRSELCVQAFNCDGNGRHVHSFVGVELTKEQAIEICKGAYDAGKRGRIPCSSIADFVLKKAPLRLGSIKPEKVGDIRLENFARLFGANLTKRMMSAITHFSKTYPYLNAKDAILEGILIMPGSKESGPTCIDGIYASKVAAVDSMDFAAKASAGFAAAELLCK